MRSIDQLDRASLLADASPHSGAWIHALPVPSLGLHMNAETIKIATGLRLGAQIMEPNHCRCGAMMDKQGHHGLSCWKNKGRYSRHADLNDVLKRTLATGGVLSRLEPVGLTPNDVRRPDGLTLSAFTHGKSLCWDATCADTFCSTALLKNCNFSRSSGCRSRREKAKPLPRHQRNL